MKSSDLRCGMFATRLTIAEAVEYFNQVTDGDPYALTGLMVVMNTVADTLDREGLQVPFAQRMKITPKHNEHVVMWKQHVSDQGTDLYDFPYND